MKVQRPKTRRVIHWQPTANGAPKFKLPLIAHRVHTSPRLLGKALLVFETPHIHMRAHQIGAARVMLRNA